MNRPFRFVFALLSLSASAWAVDGTFVGQGNGTATTANYSDTTKWTGGTVASGTGATATINLNGTTGAGATAITMTAPVTIGNLTLSNSSGGNFSLTGSGTAANSTITWATSSGTPTINLATWFSKTYNFGGGSLTFAGTQGLRVVTGSNIFSPTSGGLSWTGFSGTLTVTSLNSDSGVIDPATGGTLPATRLSLVHGTGTSTITLGMFGGRNQTIGGFDGTAQTYVRNNSTTTFSTLTLGTNNESGTFQGFFGKNPGAAATDFRSNIAITKNGSGTQTFSGTSYAAGTTTINAGTFLMNGSHIATISTTGNLAATTGTAGAYSVKNTATLGGTGTIKPFDTAGGGVMIAIESGGKLAPGDPATSSGVGTLTIDQTVSNRTNLFFATGGTASFDLSTTGNDKVAFVGHATVGEAIFTSTALNFSDLSAGLLASGQYVLFQGDSNTNYSGLTTDGSGFITAGLSIGSGLSAYTNTSLQLVGNNIVLNLTNPNAPVPVALSFNVKGTSNTGMTPAEVAGASGARFANWNNLNIASGTGSMTNLVDSNGAQVTGVSVSLSGGNGRHGFQSRYRQSDERHADVRHRARQVRRHCGHHLRHGHPVWHLRRVFLHGGRRRSTRRQFHRWQHDVLPAWRCRHADEQRHGLCAEHGHHLQQRRGHAGELCEVHRPQRHAHRHLHRRESGRQRAASEVPRLPNRGHRHSGEHRTRNTEWRHHHGEQHHELHHRVECGEWGHELSNLPQHHLRQFQFWKPARHRDRTHAELHGHDRCSWHDLLLRRACCEWRRQQRQLIRGHQSAAGSVVGCCLVTRGVACGQQHAELGHSECRFAHHRQRQRCAKLRHHRFARGHAECHDELPFQRHQRPGHNEQNRDHHRHAEAEPQRRSLAVVCADHRPHLHRDERKSACLPLHPAGRHHGARRHPRPG